MFALKCKFELPINYYAMLKFVKRYVNTFLCCIVRMHILLEVVEERSSHKRMIYRENDTSKV